MVLSWTAVTVVFPLKPWVLLSPEQPLRLQHMAWLGLPPEKPRGVGGPWRKVTAVCALRCWWPLQEGRGSWSTYFCIPWDQLNVLGFFTPRPDLRWKDWQLYPNVTSVFSFFLHFSFHSVFPFFLPLSLLPLFLVTPSDKYLLRIDLERAPLGISGEPEVYLSS